MLVHVLISQVWFQAIKVLHRSIFLGYLPYFLVVYFPHIFTATDAAPGAPAAKGFQTFSEVRAYRDSVKMGIPFKRGLDLF